VEKQKGQGIHTAGAEGEDSRRATWNDHNSATIDAYWLPVFVFECGTAESPSADHSDEGPFDISFWLYYMNHQSAGCSRSFKYQGHGSSETISK
jgi:hypothetical protein